MPPKKENRTQRFAFRLSPAERQILREVSELMSEGDTAELVRRSALAVAHAIIQIERGEIPLVIAQSCAAPLILQYAGWQKLSEMSASGKLPPGQYTLHFSVTDENGKVIAIDEETREVGT